MRPSFAHASEAELARILDFYQVRWRYEPDTFPIGWNLDGEVVESFSPDFYLPDMELYVELTTLKQKLVRKKNRKLRRLRELYPDIRIKLFYARDFRMLMLKFGRMALMEDLTGTTGQSHAAADPGPPASLARPPGPAAIGLAAVADAARAVPMAPARTGAVARSRARPEPPSGAPPSPRVGVGRPAVAGRARRPRPRRRDPA